MFKLSADYNADYFHNHNDFNRLSQAAIQQQHQRHNNMHSDVNHIYAGNMSKFFDFHKNQSQPQNQVNMTVNSITLFYQSTYHISSF